MADWLQALRALFGDRLSVLEQAAVGLGDIGRVRLGPRQIVLVQSPDLIREVLVERAEEFQKSPALRVVSRPLLGNGLLTSEGAEHDRHRKLVAPSFAHQRVHRYNAIIERHARQALSSWPETFDMGRAMTRLTLGIIGETLFDENLLDTADAIGRDFETVQRHGAWQVRLPFRLPQIPQVRSALGRLNAKIYQLIAERRVSGIDHGDLLSMLLLTADEATSDSLTDEQVRDEVMTLFIAGHETTARALAWSWYLLARNPSIFRRLQEEGAVYAIRVVKETLRLYPPAWAFGRSTLHSMELGGFKLEKDEIVIIAPWLLHRDERFFQDPLRFEPDRFLSETSFVKFSYIPFGGGKRICIGNQFALMEAQIVLATIAPEISLTTLREVRPEALLTLRPKGGVPVRLNRSNFLPSGSVLRQGAEI